MIQTEIKSILIKKSLGLTFVLSAAAMAFAQEKVNISGRITDKQNAAVPYASVTFSNKANKMYSDAALTDEKGNYQIQLVPGNYDIIVEAIDYKKVTVNRQISGGNLGNISIEAETSMTGVKTQDIQGVTITAQAPKAYRVELDKKTYDPSADIVSKGGSLQDVLQNVPSVSVETDGTVSMRGSSNVKFLINGKPSSMLGIDDGANALQSIPADQIEKIEVISNPSSKFEASGTAGILNIILKKNKKTGFNGSVTGTVGYLPQTSLNMNLGWRKGDLTWFLNGGGGYRESTGKNNNDVWYKNVVAGNLSETHQQSISDNAMKNFNASTGFVYDFNERTSMNLSGTVRTFDSEGTGNTDRSEIYLGSQSLSTSRRENSNGNNLAFQGDWGLDHKIDDEGQNIALSLSLQRNTSKNSSDMKEFVGSTMDSNDVMKQNTINRSFVGKADYELPVGEKSKLEAGYRLDINKNSYDNDIRRSTVSLPVLVNLPRFTNSTDYRESFNALYLQFKSKIGENLGYQLGLRDEFSSVKIDYENLAGENLKKTKYYNNLFPSVFLSYDLAKGSQLLLNYSRRIDRPRSFFMVPYARYSNPQSLFEGNIDLDPSYVNSYEFGYSLQQKKVTFNPTLYFRRTTDDTKMLSYRKDERLNEVYTKPLNLGSEDRYGLDLNFTYDPVSWLKLMGSLDLFGYNTEGNYFYQAIDKNGMLAERTRNFSGKGFSTRARLNSTFRFDKTFSLQLQGFFRGGQKTATSKQDAMYALNLGASKTIWNGNGTISFNIQDIFNTRNRTVYSFNEDFDSKSYMQWMPRQFSISFTYRFKEGDKVEQPKRKKDVNSNAGGDDDVPPM